MQRAPILVVALAVAVGVLLLRHKYDSPVTSMTKKQLLEGLLRFEASMPPHANRIAVGFGGCQDSILSGVPLIVDHLKIQPPAKTQDYDTLASSQEFAEAFAYWFGRGAAAERYVSDETLWKSIVAGARATESARWLLGGNALLMGDRIAKEGGDVLLGSRIAPEMRDRVHPRVKLVNTTDDDVDIHVLLEFQEGSQWGDFSAPRANRLALHRDQYNPQMESLEQLSAEIVGFKPDALVLAGFQMLDTFPFPPGQRRKRLEILQASLSRLPPHIQVHFELASLVNMPFIQEILELVFPAVTSLGMNEQELTTLHDAVLYSRLTRSSDSRPKPSYVLDQMRSVFTKLRGSNMAKLTRVHVHSLAYQVAIVTGGSWADTRAAMVKASLTATRYVCGNETIDSERVTTAMESSFLDSDLPGATRRLLPPDSVVCWDEVLSGTSVQVCLAPNLVCRRPRHTVGAGDNISAAGFFINVRGRGAAAA